MTLKRPYAFELFICFKVVKCCLFLVKRQTSCLTLRANAASFLEIKKRNTRTISRSELIYSNRRYVLRIAVNKEVVYPL